MATWLVLGAARGTGAQLVQYAVEHQHPVVALVRRQQDAERLSALNNVHAFVGDACNAESVMLACRAAGRRGGGARCSYYLNHGRQRGLSCTP